MKLVTPDISWQETGHPFSEDYEDIYFSAEDPIGESEHVFLLGNLLPERWQQLDKDQFTLAELGFGSGLNFLLACKLWNESPTRGQRLHYIGFEKHPLQLDQMQKLHALWPELQPFSEQFITQYADQGSGCHRFLLSDAVILDLHFGNAKDRLSQLEQRAGIDAWFLDGFNPKRNHALWESNILRQVARLSHSGTTLSSYSVAGSLRRNLNQIGFTIKKIRGFGRKRHMLQASYEQTDNQNQPLSEPWNKVPYFTLPSTKKKIAIIGAGLSGCSLAYSLSRRGVETKIYEIADTIAAGASGISLFSLRPRLFQVSSAIAEYYLHSFLFSSKMLQSLTRLGELTWNQCGVVQLQSALNKKSPLKLLSLTELYPTSVLDNLTDYSRTKLRSIADIETALFFPQGGFVSPASLCAAYCALSKVPVHLNTAVATLIPQESKAGSPNIYKGHNGWQLRGNSGALIDTVDAVIFANSQNISQFEQLQELPIESVSGQVTRFAGTAESNNIDHIITGERTLFPSTDNKLVSHLVAASYRNFDGLTPNDSFSDFDNEENFKAIQKSLTNKSLLQNDILQSQAAIRSSTPDRAPLVGAVPNLNIIKSRYGDLKRNANRKFDKLDTDQNYWPGLYISAAHGSNGLATCGYSAEILASLICGEQLPIGQETLDALNPIRFAIRDLKKQIS